MARMVCSLISGKSRLRDLRKLPIGRDVSDKIMLQLGRSGAALDRPPLGWLRLSTLRKLAGKRLSPGFWETLFRMLRQDEDELKRAVISSDASPETEAPGSAGPDRKAARCRFWWREAVFYQIYPRSFRDANGDGIGDLAGITERLDYLKDLGVDALWLSPVYDSPNDDNGYDIRDYRKIMTEMGSMEDFNRLLAGCKERGLRLIMDLVINHTSDEHAWFQEALADPQSPKRDWYFFRDGRGEGLPNHYVSFFSGPAWRWFEQEKTWALHLFSPKQMDLNWTSESLRQELYEMVRFWLQKGVDGFRLDVINYISKPEGLPDGDPLIGQLMGYRGVEQYFYGPHLHEYLRELRREAFDPYGAFSVGECPGIGKETGRLLTAPGRKELDLIFNFDCLENPGKTRFNEYRYDLNYLKEHWLDYEDRLGADEFQALFLDNHDNPRFLSKVEPEGRFRRELAKLLLAFQLCFRGVPFLYQGQELGEANQPFTDITQIRDVEALRMNRERSASEGEAAVWAAVLVGTRDHARVPMHWDESPNGGFSVNPEEAGWLPRPGKDPGWSAAAQEDEEDSVLRFARRLLALRHASPALRRGTLKAVQRSDHDRLAFLREAGDERMLVELNLCAEERPRLREVRRLTQVGPAVSGKEKAGVASLLLSNRTDAAEDRLRPYELRIWKLL